MNKIAILASGTGTNAENIYRFFSNGNRVKVELVIYDRRNAPVAERMRALGADTLYLPAEVWEQRPQEIVDLLTQRGIDLVVLAGFLRFIPTPLTEAFKGRIINIHPSLLPAYGGRGMYGHKVHEAVIAAGEVESGVTVHYVTEEMDGGEILLQERVAVDPTDTPESLEAKIRRIEFDIYPRAIVAALTRMPRRPGEEWAEKLGVAYDPTKLPPHYPGAVPPPVANAATQAPPHEETPAATTPKGYAEVLQRAYGDDVPKMPPAYLVWAVVMTVLCCLPAGIVAIIFSSQVSSKYYAGDIEGAQRASDRAQIWIIVSFVLGVLTNTLYLPVALLFN